MKILNQKKLIEIYESYFEFKGMTWPNTRDAADFVVTEVGEMFDALKRGDPKWVRHNDRDPDLGMEISQAIMMLVIAADEAGIDIETATYRWMKEKGFDAEYWSGKDYVLWAYATENSRTAHVWGMFKNGGVGTIQSACGLEFPSDLTFHKPFGGKHPPKHEYICKQCRNYHETKHGIQHIKRKRRFPRIPFLRNG